MRILIVLLGFLLLRSLGYTQEVTITIGYPDDENNFIYSITQSDENARFGGMYYFKVENTGTVALNNWEINTLWKGLNSTWGVVEKTVINSSTGEILLTGPGWDPDLAVGESFVLSGEWLPTSSIEDWIEFLPREISMTASGGTVSINYDTNGEVNTGTFIAQKVKPLDTSLKQYANLKTVAYFPLFDAENAWCSLRRYGQNIDQLRIQMYSITPTGELRAGQDLPAGVDPINDLHYWYNYIDSIGVINYCVSNNIELVPVVYNYNPAIGDFDQNAVNLMMTTPSLRSAHINDLIQVLIDKPVFDGIDVDYESLMSSDRDNYSTFMEDLAAAVHAQNKILTTAVHTKVGHGTWYGPQAQDFERLGNAVDEILIMTYDLHWATSPTFSNPPTTAGCQATPDWMNDVASFAISEIDDPTKIQLGLPFYGYRWKYLFENHTLNDPGVGLTYADAQALINTHGITPSMINRESNGNEPYFNVTINGVNWVCYYQDDVAITYKLSALNERDLRDYIGGIGIWRLGGENDAIWNAVTNAIDGANALIDTTIDCTIPSSGAPNVTVSGNLSICLGESTTITAGGASTYSWNTGDNTAAITVSPTITTTYTVTGTNANGTGTQTITVVVNPIPTTPVIVENSGVLDAQVSGMSYQWYLNGSLIAGATSQTFTPTQSGNYTVEVTSGDNCSAISAAFSFIYSGIGENDINFSIFPNPSNGVFEIKSNLNANYYVVCYDLIGNEVMSKRCSGNNETVDISSISSGTYLLKIIDTDGSSISERIIVKQ